MFIKPKDYTMNFSMARLSKNIFAVILLLGISVVTYSQVKLDESELNGIINEITLNSVVDSLTIIKFREIAPKLDERISDLKIADNQLFFLGKLAYITGRYKLAVELFLKLKSIGINDYYVVNSLANLTSSLRYNYLEKFHPSVNLKLETLVDITLKMPFENKDELDKIFEFANDQFSDTSSLSYVLLKNNFLRKFSKLSTSILIEEVPKFVNDKDIRMLLLINRAKDNIDNDNYDLAFNDLADCTKQNIDNNIFINSQLNFLKSKLYLKVFEPNRAYYFLIKHFDDYLITNNNDELIRNKLLSAEINLKTGNYKKSLKDLNSIKSTINSTNRISLKWKYHELRVLQSLDKSDFNLANASLYALSNLKYENNKLKYLSSFTLYKEKKFNKAYKELSKINVRKLNLNPILKEKVFKLKIDLLGKLKYTDQLFDTINEYLKIKELNIKRIYKNRISELETINKIENLKAKNIILTQAAELNASAEKKIRMILLVLLIIAVLSIVYLYFIIRIKNKANEKAVLQNEEIKSLNNSLIKNNEKLEKVIRDRDKLLSVLAHDLRNPINTITRLTETFLVAQNSLTPQEELNYKSTILQMTNSTSNILENLLEWGKANNQKIKLRLKMTDVPKLIEEVVFQLKPYADTKKVNIVTEFYFKDSIMLDSNLISSVIRNLLVNAIKFSPKNSEVKVSSNKEKGNFVLMVIDNGTGIPKDILDKLFKSEIQNPGKGTDNEGGIGLGLTLCSEFIKMHNGEIHAKNNRAGSTFYFKIPIKRI